MFNVFIKYTTTFSTTFLHFVERKFCVFLWEAVEIHRIRRRLKFLNKKHWYIFKGRNSKTLVMNHAKGVKIT